MAKPPASSPTTLSPAAARERELSRALVQNVFNKDTSLNDLLKLRVEDAPRFVALAAQYLEKDEVESAQSAAEAAVACDPNSMDAMASLGVTLAKNKEFSRAVVCFERVVQQRPSDIAQWTNLGECYLATLKYSEAATAFRHAMELDPASEHPQGRRARAIVARTLMKLQKDQK